MSIRWLLYVPLFKIVTLFSVAPGSTSAGLSLSTRCIGLARVGGDSQRIAQGTLADLDQWEMGKPLHSLVIIGHVHPMEDKMVEYACNARQKT